MVRWTSAISKMLMTAVILSGNCFVCAAGALPAAAAAPRPEAAVERCAETTAVAGGGYVDPGPWFAGRGFPAGDQCPHAVQHDQQPAIGESTAAATAAPPADLDPSGQALFNQIFSTATSVPAGFSRAGPIFSASNLIGTTIKKE